MSTSDDLHARRVQAVRAWTQFVADRGEEADTVRPEILAGSSPERVSPAVTQAPLDDGGRQAEFWNQSPCRPPSRGCRTSAPHR